MFARASTNWRCALGLVGTLTVAFAAAPVAHAQFTVMRFTVDGGGERSSGGSFAVTGTIGQPDAGVLAQAPRTLAGGFWLGRAPTPLAAPAGEEPLRFRVFAVRPNPVRTGTLLRFDLGSPERVRAGLYDAAGRLVRVLVDERLPAGAHQRTWDRRDHAGRSVAPGVYFLRLEAGAHGSRQKLVVLS